MFDNPRKELEDLQEKLLQDEDWFEQELDSAKRLIGQMPQKDIAAAAAREAAKAAPAGNVTVGSCKNDTKIWTRELNFEEEKPQPKEKGIKGLMILAVLESLGILAICAYWALFLL